MSENRIFIAEPDLIRLVTDNRAKRAAWCLYAAITLMGVLFIAGFLARVTP